MMNAKSWLERMSEHTAPSNAFYDPTYEVMDVETYAENGRVLKRSVVKRIDNREIMAQYTPADFRIENLQAVGALRDAKRYTLNPSTMDMYDSVGDAFDVLNDMVDMNVDNNVENN